MISISTSSRFPIEKATLQVFAQSCLVRRGLEGKNLVISFVGRRAMRAVMRTYHQAPRTLPVLSFPYHQTEDFPNTENLWGEVVICYPLAVLLAAEKNKTILTIFQQLIEHGIDTITTKS